MIRYISIVCCIVLSGCSSPRYFVLPVTQQMTNTCVVENIRVTVSGFKYLIIEKIQDKGIPVKGIDKITDWCDYRVNYTARRSWDIGGTFLSYAEVEVFNQSNNHKVGYVELRVSNNLRFDKYRSVETKMKPLLDKLFMYQKKDNTQTK